MLADPTQRGLVEAGALRTDRIPPKTSRREILDFVAQELPKWRDHPDRPREAAEPQLNTQLCAHLTAAARRTGGFDYLQFRTEFPDEQERARRIDLAPSPCGPMVIEGRRHTEFDMVLPIECKRLPTPKGSDRDPREYVVSDSSTTGGLQRFKLALHGGAHAFAAMIAYIQNEAPSVWCERIRGWVVELSKSDPLWTVDDCLAMTAADAQLGVTRLRSRHARVGDRPEIELEHLWVEMASAAPTV